MDTLIIGNTKTVTKTLGSDVDQVLGEYEIYVTLSHIYDDQVTEVLAQTRATRSAAGVYTYTFTAAQLNSYGTYQVQWDYTDGGDDYIEYEFFKAYVQYIDSDSFFDRNPDFETEYTSMFDQTEAKARLIIDTYCGQAFQPIWGKTRTYDGNGKEALHLGERLNRFTAVTIDGDDYVALMETKPESNRWLRFVVEGDGVIDPLTRRNYTKGYAVAITGDWGWQYVPENVEHAAELLIKDLLTDDHANFQHGINQVWMDAQRFEFTDEIFYGTGNADADALLTDYIYFIFDYVAE